MDIFAVLMGAAFAGMAVFLTVLIVVCRSWLRGKDVPAVPPQRPSVVAPVRPEPPVSRRDERISRDADELVAAIAGLTRELEDTANTVFRRFEQKERRLEQLIKDAEAAAQRLEQRPAVPPQRPVAKAYAFTEQAPVPEAAQVPQPQANDRKPVTGGKYAKAAELMATGRSAAEVSREMSLHIGELELINNLRKIGM